MSRPGCITKTRGLLHIYYLMKMPMKKSILDIQLSNRSLMSNGNTKNGVNSGWLNNRTKRLITVYTGSLTTPISNQTGFVSGKSVICIKLFLKKPNTINYSSMRWSRHKYPSFVFDKTSILFCQCVKPIRIFKGV